MCQLSLEHEYLLSLPPSTFCTIHKNQWWSETRLQYCVSSPSPIPKSMRNEMHSISPNELDKTRFYLWPIGKLPFLGILFIFAVLSSWKAVIRKRSYAFNRRTLKFSSVVTQAWARHTRIQRVIDCAVGVSACAMYVLLDDAVDADRHAVMFSFHMHTDANVRRRARRLASVNSPEATLTCLFRLSLAMAVSCSVLPHWTCGDYSRKAYQCIIQYILALDVCLSMCQYITFIRVRAFRWLFGSIMPWQLQSYAVLIRFLLAFIEISSMNLHRLRNGLGKGDGPQNDISCI